MIRLRFVISGAAPRTKKNHPVLVPARGKHGQPIQKLLPSEAYRAWNAIAQIRLLPVRQEVWRTHPEGLAMPLNCKALFYRDAERGDANGYYQGLADALQEAGVVKDDVWIRQWDGSRLLKDRDNPRIEVTLEELVDAIG